MTKWQMNKIRKYLNPMLLYGEDHLQYYDSQIPYSRVREIIDEYNL